MYIDKVCIALTSGMKQCPDYRGKNTPQNCINKRYMIIRVRVA